MNSIMERWIGSCRRELLDRTLIWNQRHLMTVLREYEDFSNTHRPHRTLNQAAPLRPLPDGVTDLDHFHVRRRDRAGGVIHEYRLVAKVFGTHRISSARSDSASGASGFFPDSAAARATFTHLLRVISWTPMFRATSATGRPPSRTKATDCSLHSGVNERRVEPISRSPDESGS